jgi:hypothetical protein
MGMLRPAERRPSPGVARSGLMIAPAARSHPTLKSTPHGVGTVRRVSSSS